MFRPGILLVIALVSGRIAPAQQWPKEMTFPSGRKVTIESVTQIHIKETDGQFGSALWLVYETKLKLANSIALQKEIDEIWTWLKVDVEHRKLTEAIINVAEPANPNLRRSMQFSFKKQPDGSWKGRRADTP